MSSQPPTYTFEVKSNGVSISTNLTQVTRKSKGSSNITYVTPTYSFLPSTKTKETGAYPPVVATNSAVYQLAEDNIPFRYVDPTDNITKTLKVSRNSTSPTDTTIKWEGDWLSLFPDGFAVLSPQQSTADGTDTITFTVRNKLTSVYNLNMQTPFLWLYQGSGNDSAASYTKYDANGAKVGNEYILEKNTAEKLSENQANYITKTIIEDIAVGGYIEFTLKRKAVSINNTYLLVSFTGLTCVRPNLSFNYMDAGNKSITSTIGTLASNPIIVSLSTNIRGDPINGKITYTNNSSFTGEIPVTNNKATITTTALGITSIEINFNFVSDSLLLYTNNLLSTNKLTYNVTSQTLITNVTLENTSNRAELTSQKLSSSTETENDATKRVRVAYNDTLKIIVKFVDSNNVVYPNVLNFFKIHVNDLEIATISTYTPEIGYTYSLDIAYIDRTQNTFSLLKTDSITRHKISLKNVTATNSTAYIVTSQTDVYFDILPVKFKVDVKNTNSGTQNTFSYGSILRLISYPVTDMAFAPSAPQAPSGLSSEIDSLMVSWTNNNYKNGFKIKDPTNQTLIYQFDDFSYDNGGQYFYRDISMAGFPIEVNASQYYVQSLLKIVGGVATYQSDNTQLFTVQKQATTLEILYLTTDNKTLREYNSPFEIEIKMTGLVNPTNENLNERSGRFSLYKIESNTETEVLNAVNNVYILNSGNSTGNIRVNIDAPTVIGVNLSQSGNFRLYFKDDEYVTSYDDFTLIGDKESANVHVSTAKPTLNFDMSEDIVFNVNTYVTTGTSGLNQKIEGYYKAPGFEYMLFQTINNTTTGLSQNTDFTFTPLNNSNTEQGVYSFRFVMTITTETEKHKYSIGERIYSSVTINKKQISFTSVLKYIGSTEEFTTSSNGNTLIPYTQESRFEITLNPPIAASFSIKYVGIDTPILTGTSGVDGIFTSATFTPEGKYFLPGIRSMQMTITPNDAVHYQGISSEAHTFNIGGITDKGFKSVALTKSTLTYLEPIKIDVSFIPLTGGAVFKGNLRIIYNNDASLVATQELSFLTEDIQTIEFPTANARFLGLNAREAVHSIKISFLPVGENNTASIYSEIIAYRDLTVVPETITLGLTSPTTAVYGEPINVSVTPSWEAAGKIDLYIGETKIGSTDTTNQNNVGQHTVNITGDYPSILDLNIINTEAYTLSVKFVSTDTNFNNVNTSETKTINISRATVIFESLSINDTSYTTYLDNGIALSIVDDVLKFSGKLTTEYTPVKSGSVRLQNGQYNSPLVLVGNTGEFSVTVPISTTTFKQSGNIALFYTNTSKFAEREFKTSDDDDIPGVVFLTVNYIPCTINFTKTQTTTDWHDGSFTFKAILNAAVYPSFTVDSNDGKTVMKIYDKQTSTLKLTKTFTYSELKNDSAGNASWTINPKTESLNAADYYITCEFAGIPYFYEDTDANDILFTVTKTVPKIKLQISDDKTFNVSKSYSSMTVIYKQQTYLALTIKTDNTINNANGDNILGISSFTYSGPASNTVALNNNVDTPEATSHGIVQNVNQIKDTINQKVISLPNTYDASAITYQIKCDFAPQDTLNYTTSFAVVTLKIDKYTPVIDTFVISEYNPSTDATNLVNNPIITGKITYNEQYTVKNKFINSVPYEFETINYGAIGGTINYKYLSKDAAPSSVTIYSPTITGSANTTKVSNISEIVTTSNETLFYPSISRNVTYTITDTNYSSSSTKYWTARVSTVGASVFNTSNQLQLKPSSSEIIAPNYIYEYGANLSVTFSEYLIGIPTDSLQRTFKFYNIEGVGSFWLNNLKPEGIEIRGPVSYPVATPLTIENQGLASIEASTALNAYTYTAIGNAQKINANNNIGYRMFVNFTPSDTVNFNATVEKVEDFNIHTANALGTVDIDLDTTSSSNNLEMTFDQKASVDINANIVFNSNVLASDRKGSLKFYKDGSDENNGGSLINSAISIDESGTTKNPYKTNVSTTITSHPIFTARYDPYFIYATLTPTNTTNYPVINAVTSRSLTIDPRIVLSTTTVPNIDGEYEIEFSKQIKIKATIHSGNPDNDLTGKVTFKFTDKNDSQKIITHQVDITQGENGNPAYAEFTTLRTNIASSLVPSKYTITCNVAFDNFAYRSKSDDGKNMVLFVKPQPVSFKLKLIKPTNDNTLIIKDEYFINNFLYKSLNPVIVSTFYTTDGISNSKVYGGTITYTITNIATSVQTVYVVTNTNTLEQEANVYTFQIPTGVNGEPVLAVGDYSITAEYDSPNFGKYTNKNMELNGTELLYSVNKNSTYVELSNNSKPYVVGSSSQSLTLSAKVMTIYGDKITGNLDRVRFTIFEDNFNDATTSPVLVVINASYSSLDDAFKTTAINTLLSGTYRVMVQFTGNESYNPSDPVYTSIIIPSLFETVANHNYAVTLDGTNYKFTVPNKSGDTVYLYMNKQLAPFENVTSLADDSVISVADSTFLTGNNIVYAVVLSKNKNKQTVYNTVTVNKPKLLITNIVVTSDKQTVAHKSAVTLSVVVTSNRPSVQVNEGQLVYTIDGTIVGYSSMLNDGTSSFTRQLFMNETATATISVSFLSSTNYDANSIVGTTSVAITKVDPPLCSLTVDSTTVKYLDKKTITLDLGDQYINGITDSATATFYDNGQIIFDNVQVLNGKATVELIFDKLVDNVITAKFNGNRNYNNKISTNSLEFSPTKDTIANKYTSITSSTSLANGFITMTVTAVPISTITRSNLLLNTGSVTFKRSDMVDIVVQLHNGQASVCLPNTTALTFTFSHPYLT
jgi:hypothetical protein